VAPSGAGLAPYEVLEGIPVHRFRYAPRGWETLAYTGTMAETVAGSLRGKLAMLGYLRGQASALRRVVQQVGANLVHAHWWFPAGLAAKPPFVLTMHGSDVRLAAQKRWAHPLFRGVLRRAAAVTTVSHWLAKQAQEIMPIADPIVAPMPVNTSLFATTAAGRNSDEILFVGRLNEQKGLHFLLHAVAGMRQRARLTVIGEGPDAGVLRQQAVALGIADRVSWSGNVSRDALARLYQRATVLAMPSVNEGLGLVAVEAQLCGTPVIAFASGGATDVITDGVTGLLVPAKDVAALATALDRVIGDSDLQVSLGVSGRELTIMNFAPEAVAARYALIYRMVLEHAAA
jgi:glycosyltransferase involved in cell wall biosynthesis